MWRDDAGRKMGAVAPTLFGAIKLLVNNRTAISEGRSFSEIAAGVKQFRNRVIQSQPGTQLVRLRKAR
jgi:hypothetical protein